MYEIFEHTADLGIRVRAGSLDELFADAARGLFAVMVANPDSVRTVDEVTFHVDGGNYDFSNGKFENISSFKYAGSRKVSSKTPSPDTYT